MSEKKGHNYESPNLSKMQPVVIDNKTTIYIEQNANAEEAKKRYLSRLNPKSAILI